MKVYVVLALQDDDLGSSNFQVAVEKTKTNAWEKVMTIGKNFKKKCKEEDFKIDCITNDKKNNYYSIYCIGEDNLGTELFKNISIYVLEREI